MSERPKDWPVKAYESTDPNHPKSLHWHLCDACRADYYEADDFRRVPAGEDETLKCESCEEVHNGPTIPELAHRYSGMFRRPNPDNPHERQQGEHGATLYFLKDECRDEAEPLVRRAHHDGYRLMFPDDWRYEFVVAALDELANANDDATLEELRELEFHIEPDIYTTDFTGWLHSRADRYDYVDQARQEFGRDAFQSITDEIQAGQVAEKREVFRAVLGFLAEEAGEED